MSGGAPMQTVYCVPIDESNDAEKDDTVVQLPLDSVYSEQESTNTLLRMLLNFGGVSVLIIATMFGTPFIYQIFISNIIKNSKKYDKDDGDDGDDGDNKINRLATSDLYASILIITTSLLMLTGFSSKLNNELIGMSGVFFIIIFFIAFARIQFEKTKGPEKFYSEYLDLSDKKEWGENTYFWKYTLDNKYYIGIGCILAVLIGTFLNHNPGLIFFIIWIIPYLKSLLTQNTSEEEEDI